MSRFVLPHKSCVVFNATKPKKYVITGYLILSDGSDNLKTKIMRVNSNTCSLQINCKRKCFPCTWSVDVQTRYFHYKYAIKPSGVHAVMLRSLSYELILVDDRTHFVSWITFLNKIVFKPNRQFQFSLRCFVADCQHCGPCGCERHGRVDQTTLVASEGGRWVEATASIDQSH